jgi:hypothetical protein
MPRGLIGKRISGSDLLSAVNEAARNRTGSSAPNARTYWGYHVDASEPCTASLPSRQSGVLIHMIAAFGRHRDITASHCLPLGPSRKEIALVQPVCALAM